MNASQPLYLLGCINIDVIIFHIVVVAGMGVMAMRNKLVETEEEANDFVSRYNKAKEENNVVGGGVNMIIVATK